MWTIWFFTYGRHKLKLRPRPLQGNTLPFQYLKVNKKWTETEAPQKLEIRNHPQNLDQCISKMLKSIRGAAIHPNLSSSVEEGRVKGFGSFSYNQENSNHSEGNPTTTKTATRPDYYQIASTNLFLFHSQVGEYLPPANGHEDSWSESEQIISVSQSQTERD